MKLRLTDRAALARHSPLGACLTVESAVCRAACGVRAGRAVAPSEEERGALEGHIACPVLRAACPPGAHWLCVRAARITPPLRVASVGSVCLRLCSDAASRCQSRSWGAPSSCSTVKQCRRRGAARPPGPGPHPGVPRDHERPAPGAGGASPRRVLGFHVSVHGRCGSSVALASCLSWLRFVRRS